jgi:hypothetical protein
MRIHCLLLFTLAFVLVACSSSRQAQQAAATEVRYVPAAAAWDDLSPAERQKIDEFIDRKMELQRETDRLTQAADSGVQADAGQLDMLQKQMMQLDAEIGSYLTTSGRRAYFQSQWQLRNK